MMPFMKEAIDTLLQKVDKISKTGEIVDFHRLLHVNVEDCTCRKGQS